MSTYNLPGPGDEATFTPAARASLALLDEMSKEAMTSVIEDRRAELSDWAETFISASRNGDKRRMQQAYDFVVSIMRSLEQSA